MRALALPTILVALFTACSELPDVGEGVCGNGILEANEDCDNPTASCVQCAIQCDATAACTKPGYSCGVDDVCHAPSGVFENEPRSELPFPVLGFRISDVDYDGYGDVVGLNATALNVRYGDPTGTLPDSYNVVTPQTLGFPAVSHLEAAGVDDVIIPTADGLVAYTGAFGVPSPRQFPLGSSDTGTAANGPNPYDAVYIDKTIALFGPSSDVPAKLRFSVMTLTSIGPFFEAEFTSLCGTTADAVQSDWQQQAQARYQAGGSTFIAFTYANTCLLRVRRMPEGSEIPRGTAGCPLLPGVPQLLQPPCDYEVTSVTGTSFPKFIKPPVLADFDGDGCPSVISQDAGAGALHEYVGTADGGGGCTIASTYKTLAIGEPGSQVLGTVPLEPAVGGLSHDALVTTFGIHAFATADDAATRLYTSDRPILRAEIGDVDSDGGVDVVLTSALPNLDIARRVKTAGAFLLVRTPTIGTVEQAVIGDFDGDLRDDLAYVENLASAQRLSIAYGSPTGLGPGVAADAFSRVEFLSPMQVPDSTDPMLLVDDLIVIDLIATNGVIQPEITVLHGSPSRTMLSFYGPPVRIAGTAFRAVVSGDFIDGTVGAGVDTTPYADLVAFQTGLLTGPTDTTPETALWLIPGLPNARLGEAVYPESLTHIPLTDQIDTCQGGLKAFCLDFAVFTIWRATEDHHVILAVDYNPAGAARLLQLDPSTIADGTFDPAKAIVQNAFPAGGKAFDLEVIDVDHDGAPELVVSFQSTNGSDGHVAICPMNANGTLGGACVDVARDVLMDPSLECVDGVRGQVLPWCESQGPQLVVACRRRPGGQYTSYIIPVGGEGGVFSASIEDTIVEVPRKLDIIQLNDVTGDEVHDLVTLDRTGGITSLQVYPQLTTRERAVCVGQ